MSLSESLQSVPSPAAGTLDGFRLSPQQKRLWSLIQRDGESGYRSQCMVVIDGELSMETLRHAVRQTVASHAA